MNFINNLWYSFINGFPDIIVAIIYLIIAFIVALIAKKVIMGLLARTGTEKFLEKTGIKDEKSGNSAEFIGKLVFLIVFLLFLPATLARLGMGNVALPITNVIESIIGFIPQLLAAAIILYIGIYVAKVIRQLVKALLDRIGLDKLQSKLGVEAADDKSTFTGAIAGIIYVLILIPVIIITLQVLGINAVAEPATTMLYQIFGYIPRIFISILLIAVGYQLAKLLAPVIESLLISVGTDKAIEKLFPVREGKTTRVSISRVVGQVVRWLIMVIFFIEAINLLNLAIITNIGSAILAYIPFVVSAIIIMGGGLIVASWIEGLISKHSPKRKTVALITKIAIIVLAAFMTLSQLGFAQNIVNYAFLIILAAVSVAFAIAFGVGGRGFASSRLAKLEKKLDDDTEEVQVQPKSEETGETSK